MQNFILIVLILGLGFFLYLIQTGDVNLETFNIRNYTGAVSFDIVEQDSISLQNSSILRLNIKGYPYDVYHFADMQFKHILRSEYYMSIYDIPLEAKDAVTATWFGTRYNFYVIEEPIEDSKVDVVYRIFKTEYPTDTTDPVAYTQFKSVRSTDIRNALDVAY